jgi:hypothetical protein
VITSETGTVNGEFGERPFSYGRSEVKDRAALLPFPLSHSDEVEGTRKRERNRLTESTVSTMAHLEWAGSLRLSATERILSSPKKSLLQRVLLS